MTLTLLITGGGTVMISSLSCSLVELVGSGKTNKTIDRNNIVQCIYPIRTIDKKNHLSLKLLSFLPICLNFKYMFKNHLIEMVLLSTNDICLRFEIRKIIFN